MPETDPESDSPDFVFWFQKGKRYHVVFVDPKGLKLSDYQWKLDGYSALFEEESGKRVLRHNRVEATVSAYLYSHDAAQAPKQYRRFWVGSVPELVAKVQELSE